MTCTHKIIEIAPLCFFASHLWTVALIKQASVSAHLMLDRTHSRKSSSQAYHKT